MFSGTVSLIVRAALAVLIVASPSFCNAQQFIQQAEYFLRKGYKYTPGKEVTDTVWITDPITGKETYSERLSTSLPLTMNGHKVYSVSEVSAPRAPGPSVQPLNEYLLSLLIDDIRACYYSDSTKRLSIRVGIRNVIVNEKGRVVFYEFNGVRSMANGLYRSLDATKLAVRVNKLMSDMPALKPAVMNGVNVTSYADIDLEKYGTLRNNNKSAFIDNNSQFEENDEQFVRRGYQYTMEKESSDTFVVIDPITREESPVVKTGRFLPSQMNGKTVYKFDEVSSPASLHTGQVRVEEYLLTQLGSLIRSTYFESKELESIRITLKHLIIDEDGRVAYYEAGPITAFDKDKMQRMLAENNELSAKINNLITNLPPMKPAVLNGVNVMSYANVDLRKYCIQGQATGSHTSTMVRERLHKQTA